MINKIFTPRMSEVMGGRHIRNDVLAIWSVEGFIEVQKMFNSDVWNSDLIMANLNLDYIREIVWGQNVEVTTEVKNIGNSSFVLVQRYYQDSHLCAQALVTLLHYNYSTHKPEPISQEIRLKLEEHLIKE
ncbi:MAG: hypothetical protein GX825_10575 [Syntrophomonadaceae bacterium]|nr:hypothetical protein [Syntrophomonadaceae bacterium]